ncbi:hypothetical protein GOBAR_DD01518 [Gossypium barbadense]|nr:hypothetical protein GOBAR_DD01518 [Gossypium barbadense]
MEAAAAVAAARGGALPMSSSSRKEWRAVSDHHLVRNHGDEVEMDRSKLGQSDERTIYEVQHGREPADVDFCSITADESLDDDVLQQRIHNITRQREELLQMEVELRAQAIARSRVLEIQSSCDSKITAHVNAVAKLEFEWSIKNQSDPLALEIIPIMLQVWAKEDLLREQNKELATFRRERDHSEAERAQHIKQIHDLQEHVQDKERQLIDLQEQYRAAQEAILYKDEQLRDAQTWISRVQEMDALQSSTNHSLQAELRERTEQYNQLWHGCQRQFAEMERLHLHTIHQLQLELADVRERNGSYTDGSHMSQTKSKDLSQFGQTNGKQVDSNGSGGTNANTGIISNGASDNVQTFVSPGNAPNPNQNDHVPSVPIAPLGLPTYLPPGQVSALHPFIMHQQGAPHSVTSHVGHYSMPDTASIQQWQNQLTSPEGLQLSAQNHIPPPQTDQKLGGSDVKYEYDLSVNGQAIRSDYLDHINQGAEPNSVISSSSGKAQVDESINASYLVDSQPEPTMPQVSSQFHDALRLSSEPKEQNILNMNNHVQEDQIPTAEETSTAAAAASPSHDTSVHSVNFCETTIKNGTGAIFPEKLVSTGQTNNLISAKTSETALLDERSLLACIVRTIPTGGKIRISSTLPNRLGKMLAPLHWHDYKKKYGKLDDFVASHPAKGLPTADSNHAKNENAAFKGYAVISKTAAGDHSQLSGMQNQHPNGVSFGVAGNLSNVKILSKSNGANSEISSLINVESKASGQGRSNSNFAGKQQGRATGAALSSRR